MRRSIPPIRRGRRSKDPRADEWAHLLEGALESANVTRWVLERGQTVAPTGLGGTLRKHAFEVSVVDQFHRLAQTWFARADVAAVWERPFPTGRRGKPLAVDIALFNETKKTEKRLEFGKYTKTKLRDDSLKLANLTGTTIMDYPKVENFVLLWEEHADRSNSRENLETTSRAFSQDAAAITAANVRHRITTCVDLFATTASQAHTAVIGVFEVVQ